MLLQHPVLLQYTLLQHPLSSTENASTSSDILAAASHATAAAVLISGSTSTHMKVNVAATFGQKMPPIWASFIKLHRRFRPRDEPGQERHAACVTETARRVVCTPKTVQGFDPTCAQGIILYCTRTPEAICQKCIIRTKLFLADNDPGTPKKVVVVAAVHHISWATARAGPSKHAGGLMGTVDVVVIVV